MSFSLPCFHTLMWGEKGKHWIAHFYQISWRTFLWLPAFFLINTQTRHSPLEDESSLMAAEKFVVTVFFKKCWNIPRIYIMIMGSTGTFHVWESTLKIEVSQNPERRIIFLLLKTNGFILAYPNYIHGFRYEIFIHVYNTSFYYPLLLLKIPFSTSPPFIFMFWFGKMIGIFILNDPVCVLRVA